MKEFAVSTSYYYVSGTSYYYVSGTQSHGLVIKSRGKLHTT